MATSYPTASTTNGGLLDLCLTFKPLINGYVNGVTFYKYASNTVSHTGKLWDSAGNLLASVVFSGETASGVQSQLFGAPVAVTSGVTYVVSVNAQNQFELGTFIAYPVTNTSGNLQGLNSGIVYNTTGTFPGLAAGGFASTTFGVDVLFTTTVSWLAVRPVISGDVSSNSSSVETVVSVGGSTAAAVATGTVLANAATNLNTLSTIVRRDGAGNFTAGTITAALNGNATTASACSGNSATATTCTTIPTLSGQVSNVGNAITLTNAGVTSQLITGYVSGAGVVAATDSILQAINKLNANDATNANLTGEVTSVGNATTMVTASVTGKLLTGYTGVAGTIAATDSILSFANKIAGNLAAGTTAASVTGKAITGFVSGAGAITAADTILTAINKLSGNTAALGVTSTTATANALVLRDVNADTGVRDLNLRRLKSTFLNNVIFDCDTGLNATTTNVLVGLNAGNQAMTQWGNVCVGQSTGQSLTAGYQNVFLGWMSGKNTTTGTNNIAIGPNALFNALTTSLNIAIGSASLQFATASGNTALGNASGTAVTTGTNCTFVGNSTDTSLASATNSTAIGNGAVVSASNQVVLGNANVSSTQTFGTFKCGGAVFATPTTQGTYMGWNRNGFSGVACFANQMGGGSGGFEWVNYNGSNVLTTPNPLMTLDASGNLNVNGKITSSASPCFGYASFNFTSTGAYPTPTIPVSGTYYNLGGAIFSSLGSNITISGTTITVPSAGYYQVDYRVRIQAIGNSNSVQSIIQVNGASNPTLQTSLGAMTTGLYSDILATTVLNLAANDAISFPMLTMKIGAAAQSMAILEGHFQVRQLS
jgi:hypothetical protein